MQLGALLHQLWRHKLGLALCALLAALMALWSVYKVELSPPGLRPRALEIGAASTQVLVDSPQSKVLDLRAQTNDYVSMTTRADLLSNVMASSSVRVYIARRAGIPVDQIEAQASIAENGPRAAFEPDSERRASDLISESDRYRLSIAVNPTLPVIYVNAQGPTANGAQRLAAASVSGLTDYLTVLANQQHVKPGYRTRLLPLATAKGEVINPGVRLEVLLLTFVVIFIIACAAMRVVLRVRHGWSVAGKREKREGPDWWLPPLDGVAAAPSPAPSTRE